MNRNEKNSNSTVFTDVYAYVNAQNQKTPVENKMWSETPSN